MMTMVNAKRITLWDKLAAPHKRDFDLPVGGLGGVSAKRTLFVSEAASVLPPVAFLLHTFLWRDKEKYVPPRHERYLIPRPKAN